jgi:hypothetical protein
MDAVLRGKYDVHQTIVFEHIFDMEVTKNVAEATNQKIEEENTPVS